MSWDKTVMTRLEIEIDGVALVVDYHPGYPPTRWEPPEDPECVLVTPLDWAVVLRLLGDYAFEEDLVVWDRLQEAGASFEPDGYDAAQHETQLAWERTWDRIEDAAGEAYDDDLAEAMIARHEEQIADCW